MNRLPLFLFPFVLAAGRSLTLGLQSPSRLATGSTVPAEKECEFLTVVTFSLVGLLVALSLMVWFPDLGAVNAEYNYF
jgi:hypothetical protein